MKLLSSASFIRFFQVLDLKYGNYILFFCAFVDSSVFAMPVTTIFLITIMMRQTSYLRALTVVTLGTVVGGLTGYLIGHLILIYGNEKLIAFIQFLLDHIPGFSADKLLSIRGLMNKWGILIFIGSNFTPVPYSILSLSSGLLRFNFLSFAVVTLMASLLRYSFVGLATIFLKQKIRIELKSRLKRLSVAT